MPVPELRERLAHVLHENERLFARLGRLETALRDAIRDTRRVSMRQTAADPRSPTFEYEWTDQVKGWAALCSLDLTGMTPEAYD